jgi:hypothetical protein
MSTNAIVKIQTATIENVSFSEAKRNKQGGIGVSIKYAGQNMQLRLPKMSVPGGLSQRDNEQTGGTSYSLAVTLKGCDSYAKERSSGTDDISKLYNFLLDLDAKVIQTAVENSSKWFGKKRGEESIRDSFKSILSVSQDKVDDQWVPNGKYAPSLRVKVPVYEGRVDMDAIDPKGNPIYITPDSLTSLFPKGVETGLCVTGSIYVVGQSFGVTWRIRHAQVFPSVRQTAASIFMDEENLDEEEEAPAQMEVSQSQVEEPAPAPAVAEAPATTAGRKRRVAVPT